MPEYNKGVKNKMNNKQSIASRTNAILKRYNLTAQKRFGQNFLIDETVLEKIIAASDIAEDELVIEIGAGLGVLTARIAEKSGHTAAIEIDRRLVEVLRDIFSGDANPEIVEGDALKIDFDAFAAERGFSHYKIIANLPYYITTPVIMHILENSRNWTSMVLMMQKEVADRLISPPGGKDCGVISLAVQYRASMEHVASVSPQSFVPRPGVDSAVLRFNRLEAPPIVPADEKLFFAVIAAAFCQRRKTLLNSLSGSTLYDRDFWSKCLEACGIDSVRRGETLSLQEFATIADYCAAHSC